MVKCYVTGANSRVSLFQKLQQVRLQSSKDNRRKRHRRSTRRQNWEITKMMTNNAQAAGTKPRITSSIHQQILSQSAKGPVDVTTNERTAAGDKLTIPSTIKDRSEIVSTTLALESRNGCFAKW